MGFDFLSRVVENMHERVCHSVCRKPMALLNRFVSKKLLNPFLIGMIHFSCTNSFGKRLAPFQEKPLQAGTEFSADFTLILFANAPPIERYSFHQLLFQELFTLDEFGSLLLESTSLIVC